MELITRHISRLLFVAAFVMLVLGNLSFSEIPPIVLLCALLRAAGIFIEISESEVYAAQITAAKNLGLNRSLIYLKIIAPQTKRVFARRVIDVILLAVFELVLCHCAVYGLTFPFFTVAVVFYAGFLGINVAIGWRRI